MYPRHMFNNPHRLILCTTWLYALSLVDVAILAEIKLNPDNKKLTVDITMNNTLAVPLSLTVTITGSDDGPSKHNMTVMINIRQCLR